MARIEFADNHEDLSTETGHQFKFFCESCGNGYMSEFEAGKFCQECGAPLASEAECPRCGNKFKAGAKFCPECGAKTS